MIIVLKGADFSTSNIGTLDSWFITKAIGSGATVTNVTVAGESVGTTIPGSIKKDSALEIVLTIADGIEFTASDIVVTMGGSSITPSISDRTITISIASVTNHVDIKVNIGAISDGGGEEDEPTPGGTYTITYKYMSGSTEIKTATTETVAAGTSKTFSTSNAPTISGYTISSVSPTSATINSDTTVTYMYDAEAATTATLTVNPTPSDAKVTLYAKGYTQSGKSITVANDGTVNPTYQVTKDNYLSQGGMISKIKSSQTLDITLQPFSTGNWTDISSTAEKVADYFVVDASGKFNGPYSNWCHWIIPATPGKKYRITATAGQSARLWGFYTDKPVSDGSVKPISVSSNSGMTVKIADEAVAPEGTVYLVVNNRISNSDTTAIIEVLD